MSFHCIPLFIHKIDSTVFMIMDNFTKVDSNKFCEMWKTMHWKKLIILENFELLNYI